jgi:thiamine biosynthesis protein ThiI
MYPPDASTVLVRYGEIGVKSDSVQRRMEAILRENIEQLLRREGIDAEVKREFTRLYVETSPDRIERVTDVVTDCFGVVSASPSRRVDPTRSAITGALAESVDDHYGGDAAEDSRTFAVRARRAGDEDAHPFSSTDLEQEGGAAVWERAAELGRDPTVDLEDPDVTFFVECREDDAYVFLEKRDGPGGLPYGTQEPVVALLSGGIDSPVAAYEMMKRGCPVYPLYIDLGAFGGVDNRMRAVETVRALSSYVPDATLPLLVAPGGAGIERIAETTDTCRMLVARRFMFRIAEQVAANQDAVGLVTGESIGQKSSQTSANLRVTSAVTDLPIHRPLATMDKTEITARASEIGTLDDSTIETGCHRLAPPNPATRPPLSTVRETEPENIDELVTQATAGLEQIEPDDEGW